MAENYILVAGRAPGGNAAFQNHLVRYLISAEKNFSTELIPANGRDSLDIQDEWDDLWSEGKLPKGAGQPKDFAYRVQPLGKHKEKPPLHFAFLEVSGTDLNALTELAGLLGNPKLNFVLVLLCNRSDPSDAPNQDETLAGVVASLKSNPGEEFASRCPVLLLAFKAQEEAGESEGVEEFVGDNLPATFAALQDWQGRYTLGELDMGELEHTEDGDPLLHSPKFEDMGKVFRWIYFQFTRYTVVEPFFTRLWKGLRKSISQA